MACKGSRVQIPPAPRSVGCCREATSRHRLNARQEGFEPSDSLIVLRLRLEPGSKRLHRSPSAHMRSATPHAPAPHLLDPLVRQQSNLVFNARHEGFEPSDTLIVLRLRLEPGSKRLHRSPSAHMRSATPHAPAPHLLDPLVRQQSNLVFNARHEGFEPSDTLIVLRLRLEPGSKRLHRSPSAHMRSATPHAPAPHLLDPLVRQQSNLVFNARHEGFEPSRSHLVGTLPNDREDLVPVPHAARPWACSWLRIWVIGIAMP